MQTRRQEDVMQAASAFERLSVPTSSLCSRSVRPRYFWYVATCSALFGSSLAMWSAANVYIE